MRSDSTDEGTDFKDEDRDQEADFEREVLVGLTPYSGVSLGTLDTAILMIRAGSLTS
jgi:hypothetical protein